MAPPIWVTLPWNLRPPRASTLMVTSWPGCISRELGLFEVGGDPEIGERDDGQEILPDAEVGADLDVLLVDDAGGGGGDVGVGEVELGLIDLGLGLLDVGGGGVGVRPAGR